MADKTVQSHLNKLRKDKFILILTIPNILKGLNTRSAREDQFLNLDSLQFSVYDIIIPSSSVSEEALHYAGQNYNVTTYNRPPYAPCRINFDVDNEFKNYWVLWKWMQLLNDPMDSTYAGKTMFPGGPPRSLPTQLDYLDNRKHPNAVQSIGPEFWPNYVTSLELRAKDEYNNDKTVFTFKHSFITKLGELTYNYRDPDQLGCFFEFVFNQLDVHLV